MKRKIKIAISVVLAAVLVIGGGILYLYFAGDITGAAENVSVAGRPVPEFQVDTNGDFTIMQITDTHLYNSTGKKNINTLLRLKEQIEAQKPDLVVATGDIFDGLNPYIFISKQAAIEGIAEMFEELGQYWAFVPGNNEGDIQGSERDVVALLSAYPHCIVANEENLTGATQYTIDLKDADSKIVHTLVFMDSLARKDGGYDNFKDDQVAWFVETAQESETKNPGGKISLFFHMNSPLFNEAAENGEAYKEGYATLTVVQDEKYIPANEAIDKAILEAGNVGLIAIGHAHPETNLCSLYKGIYFHIAHPSGYEGAKEPGVIIITIHTNETETIAMYDFEEIVY